MEKQKIIYFRESAVQSILADASTFLFLGILFAFNHFVLDDSKVTACVFFVVFILYTVSKSNAKKYVFTDKEAMIKHLQEEV